MGGDLLPNPIKDKTPSDGENGHLKFGSNCMQGWRKRMEDAHINDISQGKGERFDIFGVFDGHGGKEVAQFVKNHFTQEFLKHPKIDTKYIDQVIIDTFANIDALLKDKIGHDELVQLAEESKKEDEEQAKKLAESGENKDNKMAYGPGPAAAQGNSQFSKTDVDHIAYTRGCTACVCVFDNQYKKIYFANCGDSRVVMFKNGVAYRMSLDHKPDLEIEKNRIKSSGGRVDGGRIRGNINLSRGLGDLEYKMKENILPKDQMVSNYPDIREVSLDSGEGPDFIIIGCDGIWDCLFDQEACDLFNQNMSEKKNNEEKKISEAIACLLDTIIAKDSYSTGGIGCDNMTCIVIQLKKNEKKQNSSDETQGANNKINKQ